MIALLVFSAAIGWCGTPYPFWWWRRFKKPTPPIPPPPPDWFLDIVGPRPQPWRQALGIAGGVIGGILVSTSIGAENWGAIGFGALAGGRIVSELGLAIANRANNRAQ